MATLKDVEHLLLVIAEDVPVTAVGQLPDRGTVCRNYHLTPAGEERAERIWPSFAVVLREAGVTVHLRASMPDTLGEITVLEANADTVAAVLAGLDDLPAGTLVAMALAGGDAAPVDERWGASLGAPGTLFLHTPWAERAWVSEEVCDHVSLIHLCERWAAERGLEARLWLSEWRRRVCGTLVDALDLGESAEVDEAEQALHPSGLPARPLPYAPSAEVSVDGDSASLLLANVGAASAVHLRIEEADTAWGLTVSPSSPVRPRSTSVPLAVVDGAYDVTVTGPGFTRRLTGSTGSAGPAPASSAQPHDLAERLR